MLTGLLKLSAAQAHLIVACSLAMAIAAVLLNVDRENQVQLTSMWLIGSCSLLVGIASGFGLYRIMVPRRASATAAVHRAVVVSACATALIIGAGATSLDGWMPPAHIEHTSGEVVSHRLNRSRGGRTHIATIRVMDGRLIRLQGEVAEPMEIGNRVALRIRTGVFAVVRVTTVSQDETRSLVAR